MAKLVRAVTKRRLGESAGDREYWLSRPPAERVAHVQELRADYF